MMKTASLMEAIADSTWEDKEGLLNFCENAPQLDISAESMLQLFEIRYEKGAHLCRPPFRQMIIQLATSGVPGLQKSIVLVNEAEEYGVYGTEEWERNLIFNVFSLVYGEWTAGFTYVATISGVEGRIGISRVKSQDLTPVNEEIEKLKAAEFVRILLHIYYVLGASNVQRETHLIDEKLNKSRRKKGKPEIREYQTIKILLPGSQRNPSLGGTHASPIPHQRRAHQRHYKNGKVVWVKDCNVNPDPNREVPQRTYEVRFKEKVAT